jgi:hypothetical protein
MISTKPDITTLSVDPPVAKGELVVLAQPEPTLAELDARDRQGHAEATAAAVNAVGWAIETGKALLAAKKKIGHGNFEDFVAVEFPFTIRAAQNYMKMARGEVAIRQAFVEKTNGYASLKLKTALKYLDKLGAKGRRK